MEVERVDGYVQSEGPRPSGLPAEHRIAEVAGVCGWIGPQNRIPEGKVVSGWPATNEHAGGGGRVEGCAERVELGDDLVGRIDVNFLSYDTPVAKFSAPTAALSQEKQEWGRRELRGGSGTRRPRPSPEQPNWSALEPRPPRSAGHLRHLEGPEQIQRLRDQPGDVGPVHRVT